MSQQDAYLFEDDFTEDDWHESILQGRTDSLSFDRSSCHVAITVDFAKYKAAVRFVLGYSWVDEAKNLRREVPVFHPVWPWLFAKAVTNITFKGPTGTDQSEWDNSVPFGVYQYAEIEIDFGETAYLVLRDEEVDPAKGEAQRYTEQEPVPYTELFQIDGGQLTAYAPTIGTINGKHYVGAPYILTRSDRSAFTLTWRQVPAEFLYDSNGYAPKLAAIQKRVNKTTFLGRVPGTLMCETAKAVKKPQPVATDVFDELSFCYDVVFEMKETNPDPGDTSAVDAAGTYFTAGTVFRGWNLLPGPRDPATAGNHTWGWYYFTHDGTATGKPQFESYEFSSVFTHWSL